MTNKYKPDNWVIVEIDNDGEPFYKVLAGWSGGYLDGDSWRMNSGITSIEAFETYYLIHGESGSIYQCYKNREKLRFNNSHIADKIHESGRGRIISFKNLKL